MVCGDGALSDMLSTACFVLGLEESAPLLSQYGAEAVFVDKEDNVFVTGGLKDKLVSYTHLDVYKRQIGVSLASMAQGRDRTRRAARQCKT